MAPRGELGLKLIKGNRTERVTMADILRDGFPRRGLPPEVNEWRRANCARLIKPMLQVAMINRLHIIAFVSQLRLTLIRGGGGRDVDLGLASLRVVTDDGAEFLVDAFQNTAAIENMHFHGFGTGGAAEGVGNVGLTTEFTTEYASDNVRPTGSQTEAAANIFRTVATFTPDSGGTLGVTEHGIFDQAAVAGGTLWDRSLFSVVNVVAGADSLQATYDLTITSGG